MRTVRNGARLVPRFQNLPEVVFRKHHRVLLLGRMKDLISDLQQIGPERQMGAMLFQNPERQKASPLGLFDSHRNSAAVSSSQCTESLACVHPGLVHNTAIARAINTLRMNFFSRIRGILALTRPVTLVTMTCRWWQDMIQCQAFP